MSCRIIGRTVEKSFLATVLDDLKSQGIEEVFGIYIPTPKNTLVKDFYMQEGFSKIKDSLGNTETKWHKILDTITSNPLYIEVIYQ